MKVEGHIDISIIIPVYNSQAYIRESIDSVLNQATGDFNLEIIIVNDASTDSSKVVLGGYKDARIKYHEHHENKGLSAARNTGLKMARGEWVLFLDSDDRLGDNLFSVFRKNLQSDINCYLFSMIFEFNGYSEKRTITDIVDIRAFSCLGSACNKILKREICLLFKEGYLHEDICFNVDMMNAGKLKIALLEDAYYLYNRKNTSSITSHFNKIKFKEMFSYLYSQLNYSDDLTKKYILEISLGLIFHMPVLMSLQIALRSSVKLFRFLPSVLINGMRYRVKTEIVRE